MKITFYHITIKNFNLIKIQGSEDEEKRLEKEKKREKKRKEREEKPKKERKRKAESDEKKPRKKKEKTGPKRATSAYFYFLAEEREKIKAENPDIKITEISKIAGQRWKECDADRKAKYDALAKTDKERYEREKREWIASGGAAAASSSKPKKAPSKKPKSDKSSKSQSPVRASPQKAAKSAEFVADDSSSSDEDQVILSLKNPYLGLSAHCIILFRSCSRRDQKISEKRPIFRNFFR